MSNIEQQIKDVVTQAAHVNFWHTKGQASTKDLGTLKYKFDNMAERVKAINKEWRVAQRIGRQALRKKPNE